MKKINGIMLIFSFLSCFFTSVFAIENAPLAKTHWQLITLMGKSIPKLIKEQPYLLFDGKNTFNGFSGCNHIIGNYELKKSNNIHFAQGASTLMACADGMETEAQFWKMLSIADTYSIEKNQLRLYHSSKTPLAIFEATAEKK